MQRWNPFIYGSAGQKGKSLGLVQEHLRQKLECDTAWLFVGVVGGAVGVERERLWLLGEVRADE